MVFDLDGIVLNSLDKLSECMIKTVSTFCQSQDQLNKFIDFDLSNPGLSRFEKIDYFIGLSTHSVNIHLKNLRMEMLERFNAYSLDVRLNSQIDSSILQLREFFNPDSTVLVSNCDNQQLLVVSAHFGLHQIFRGGIVGTPPNKEIRVREIHKIYNANSAWSISDSESDALIARKVGLNFIFIQNFARDSGEWLIDGELKFENLRVFLDSIIN
jgi:phosphoglycolate phosphatase-like HAD superfamily hydrolase